jgi:hypothetical protein
MEEDKQKKIKLDIRRRKTNYKNSGYEIISGHGALDILMKSETHTLLGVDTDYWSSIEYIESNNLFNDENIDFYLYRHLSDGKFHKELRVSKNKAFTDYVAEKNWAVRKVDDMRF